MCYYAKIRREVTQNLAVHQLSALEVKKLIANRMAATSFLLREQKKLMPSRYFTVSSGIYILTEGGRFRKLFNDSDVLGC